MYGTVCMTMTSKNMNVLCSRGDGGVEYGGVSVSDGVVESVEYFSKFYKEFGTGKVWKYFQPLAYVGFLLMINTAFVRRR